MPVEATWLPRTVVLQGNLGEKHKEGRAGGAIKPGHLIKVNSTAKALGDLPTVVVFGSAGPAVGNPPSPMFAKEDTFIGSTIDTAYASGDLVPYHYAQKGDIILARVAASAAAVVIGDPITVGGDGTVKKGNGTTEYTFARADAALDNSAGSSEAFLRIEIL